MIVTEKTRSQYEENFSKDNPVATYVKKIPAKIEVKVLDMDTGMPKNVILFGTEGELTSYIRLYTDYEKIFFVKEQKNVRHINGDRLMEVKTSPSVADHKSKTDAELLEVLSHLTKLKSFIKGEGNTEALAIRLLKLATEHEKPGTYTDLLQKHLSSLQGAVLQPVED